MLIDHARTGMTHLADDPLFRDAGGQQLADECVPCNVRPAIGYLGFFYKSTPEAIPYRRIAVAWANCCLKYEANVLVKSLLIVSCTLFR